MLRRFRAIGCFLMTSRHLARHSVGAQAYLNDVDDVGYVRDSLEDLFKAFPSADRRRVFGIGGSAHSCFLSWTDAPFIPQFILRHSVFPLNLFLFFINFTSPFFAFPPFAFLVYPFPFPPFSPLPLPCAVLFGPCFPPFFCNFPQTRKVRPTGGRWLLGQHAGYPTCLLLWRRRLDRWRRGIQKRAQRTANHLKMGTLERAQTPNTLQYSMIAHAYTRPWPILVATTS